MIRNLWAGREHAVLDDDDDISRLAATMSTGRERIFEDVSAYVSTALPELYRKKLMTLISTRRGRLVNFDDTTLTHYVTDTLPPPDSLEYIDTRPGLSFVTPFWVERTLRLDSRQEPAFYSPHPSMLFSGVVATSSDLSQSDNEIMAAGISSLGGQWRKAVTRDVTHVFTLSSGSNKYKTAMHFKDTMKMAVVVPHWFDDTVRLGLRNLPTEGYEWPYPRVFEGQAARTLKELASSPAEVEESSAARRSKPPSAQKKALYDTIFNETGELPKQRPASARIWEGRKIMFGSNLGFKPAQREAHIADVLRAGGEVVEYDTADEELEKLGEADVYIAQYRSGRAFVKVRYVFHYVFSGTNRVTGIQAEEADREPPLVLVRSQYRDPIAPNRSTSTLPCAHAAY